MRTATIIVLVCSSLAVGDVFNMSPGMTSLEMVTVGNPGNAGDTRYPRDERSSFGSVSYDYQIGKYEVTAGQYCEFLNAVAKTDAHGLYNEYMGQPSDCKGCNIQRSGSPGRYSYSVPPEWANRPVDWASWGDAARFANWLTNGQRSGVQDGSTTENGSYLLCGATTDEGLAAVVRSATARYVIPTKDEWYKAAYYDPSKPGGAGYWDYPTRSDAVPSNMFLLTGANNANYWNTLYTIGGPYWRTEVGAFENSGSGYGTFDQGGNVWEWNEASWGFFRGLRGGSFNDPGYNLQPSSRGLNGPAARDYMFGFRIAEVPEPAAFMLLALGGLVVMRRRIG